MKVQTHSKKSFLVRSIVRKHKQSPEPLQYLDYDGMYKGLQEAYREAAVAGNALLADVGTAFYLNGDEQELYAEDGSHPNENGSRLAARIIADTILVGKGMF